MIYFSEHSTTKGGRLGPLGSTHYYAPIDFKIFHLVHFGGRQFISGRGNQNDLDKLDNRDNMVDYEDFKHCMRNLVKKYNDYCKRCGSGCGSFGEHVEVIHAITTNLQPASEGYLETLGFKRTRPYPSSKYHGLSLVSFWFMPCEDFLNAID